MYPLVRGGLLRYPISWALGATAFTARRVACTVGRIAGGIFLSCSETGISTVVGISGDSTSSGLADKTGGRAVGQQLAAGLGDHASLGGRDRLPTMDDLPLAGAPPAAGRYGPHEVDLGLDCRVADSGGQRGVDGATHCRFEQRHGQAPMDDPDRVVDILPRPASADGHPPLTRT